MLALRAAKGFVVIPQATIIYITSLGGVVTVHADTGRFWSALTFAGIESRLDPRRFVRLDQSRIVNVTRLAELLPWTLQRYRLVLADAASTELLLSRDVGRGSGPRSDGSRQGKAVGVPGARLEGRHVDGPPIVRRALRRPGSQGGSRPVANGARQRGRGGRGANVGPDGAVPAPAPVRSPGLAAWVPSVRHERHRLSFGASSESCSRHHLRNSTTSLAVQALVAAVRVPGR